MTKTKIRYTCLECGYVSPVSLGRCPNCQAWDSLKPEPQTESKKTSPAKVISLGEVSKKDAERIPTGLSELDRVLGGGMVSGGVILLSGEPGVGKSTLLLQAASNIAKHRGRLLYVTGEESASQVRLRAERLNLKLDELFV
ncbi:MAG: AAA family ATPase, partial [Deltaproteobacteria bacterium]|nr:AAA family ATPase [Deltaproteobacteria bacterium]